MSTKTHARVKALTRGELARLTGCNAETIRYYETQGVLPAPRRAENGCRLYDRRHISVLNFIRQFRDLGFSLNQCRSLLRLERDHSGQCQAVANEINAHIEVVEERITVLKSVASTLRAAARKCSIEPNAGCHVLDALLQVDADKSSGAKS